MDYPTCPHCGRVIEDTWTLCPDCGGRLRGKAICAECGKMLWPSEIVCSRCGQAVPGREPAIPLLTPPPNPILRRLRREQGIGIIIMAFSIPSLLLGIPLLSTLIAVAGLFILLLATGEHLLRR